MNFTDAGVEAALRHWGRIERAKDQLERTFMSQLPTLGRIVHLVVCNEFGLEIVRHPAIVTHYRPDGRMDLTVFWRGAAPGALEAVGPKPEKRVENSHHWEWPPRAEATALTAAGMRVEPGSHPHQIESIDDSDLDKLGNEAKFSGTAFP